MEDKSPEHLVAELVSLLDVVPRGSDCFEGATAPLHGRTGNGRVFGGLVIAQALLAAEATVPDDRPPASLHAYFLRPGNDDTPIRFDVTRDLDGRAFSNRRVVATQGDRPILTMTLSFHRREDGLSHQDPMPQVAGPEDLPSDLENRRRYLDRLPEDRHAAFAAPRPIDQRSVEGQHWLSTEPAPPVCHNWFRAVAQLPDDPRIHRALLAYASDFGLLRTSVMPHGVHWFRGELQDASLDHAVWFHDDFRADEWLLHATQSPWAGRARGYNRGQIFTRDGRLVASTSQEGLIRDLRGKA